MLVAIKKTKTPSLLLGAKISAPAGKECAKVERYVSVKFVLTLILKVVFPASGDLPFVTGLRKEVLNLSSSSLMPLLYHREQLPLRREVCEDNRLEQDSELKT